MARKLKKKKKEKNKNEQNKNEQNKNSQKKKEEKLYVDGEIEQALPDRFFKVKIGEESNQREILGYLSGKMTKNYIRVTLGDWVRVELSPYDLSKGRIVFRYSKRPRKN